MKHNHDEDLDGNEYIAEREYEDEDVGEYDNKDDNRLDLNLYHRPRLYQYSSTGYVPNPSNQQRGRVTFDHTDVSPISTNTNVIINYSVIVEIKYLKL